MKKALAALVAIGAFSFAPAMAEETIIDAGGAAYVVVDDSTPSAQIWEETNGEAGLQREAVDGRDADTQLA